MLIAPPDTPWDLRFRFLGFHTTISPWFWLAAVLLSGELLYSDPKLSNILAWVLAMFISILVHELGHAATGRRFGMFRQYIVLYHFGGLAGGDGNLSYRERLQMILAGPGAGFALAFLTYVAAMVYARLLAADVVGHNAMLLTFLSDMLYINIFWSILNLMPVYPLDGGQVSMLMLHRRDPFRGRHRALTISMYTGMVLGVVFLIAFRSMFGAVMFGMLAWGSYQMLQQGGDGWGGGGGRWQNSRDDDDRGGWRRR